MMWDLCHNLYIGLGRDLAGAALAILVARPSSGLESELPGVCWDTSGSGAVPVAWTVPPVAQCGPEGAKKSHRRGSPSHRDPPEPEVSQQTPGSSLSKPLDGPGRIEIL